MSEGRGSAAQEAIFIVMAVLLYLVLIHTGSVHAAMYTVGGTNGWTLNTVNWPKGRRFLAGDVIAFNYDPTIHNVVFVNRGDYVRCRTPAGAKILSSGRDRVKLTKGLNFFICNVPGHCESGMKIAIYAIWSI